MKKFLLCALFAVICYGASFAQDSYYVSANGSNANGGLSEDKPLRSLATALFKAQIGSIKKIIVIGTLTERSEQSSLKQQYGSVFNLFDYRHGKSESEILITGKPGASANDRAVLSGNNSQAGVVFVFDGLKLRFEHIEISNAEQTVSEKGIIFREGILVGDNSRVTLGIGVVVTSNQSTGIFISTGGSCILDGGTIQNNDLQVYLGKNTTFIMQSGIITNSGQAMGSGGVYINDGSVFTMSGGSITNNTSLTAGGGVCVTTGGTFIMSGGSITSNQAIVLNNSKPNDGTGIGGGVAVFRGGRFDQTGGTITGNTAKLGADPNVYRAAGSLGSSPSSSSKPTGAQR